MNIAHRPNADFVWDLGSAHNLPWAYQLGFFTVPECQRIVAQAQALPHWTGSVGNTNAIDPDIRRGQVAFFPNSDPATHWIFQRVAQGVADFNQRFWRLDINEIEILQFTCYQDPGDFYGPHVDLRDWHHQQRKLSFSIQLSDPSTYHGSDLVFPHGRGHWPPVRDQGAMIVFPSWCQHEVTPLTQGQRYSLVGWVLGPPLR